MNIEYYYDSMAIEYDYLINTYRWNLKYWVPKKAYNQNNTILDVACGTGYLSKILKPIQRNITLHGCDISDKMLSLTMQKKCYSMLYKYDLNTINTYIYDIISKSIIQKPVQYYDYIFCIGALEYISFDNLKLIFIDIFNQLKKGGIFIFNTHVHKHPFINDIIVHNIMEILDLIQPYCFINLVEPKNAYTLPNYSKPIWYHIWHTTKK